MDLLEDRPETREPALLVAYDGSPAAERALLHAADLVGRGGFLTVVNVLPAQSVSARLETVSDEQRARQRQLLREAKALLARRRVQAEVVDAIGDPVTEILAAAEETGATVLVVGCGGSRAKHPLRRPLSTKLLRAAKCDVLVVHEGAD